MQSQNTKVNNLGKISCLGLLALTLALTNPLNHSSAFAEEIEDYDIDTQALSTSSVNISFSPASGSTSLTPITSAGQSAQINVSAKVDVANSGGYSVYLKSNSQNLVGVNNPSNVIPGIAGNVTYDNLATNTWGYYATEGSSVPENATYKAVSTGQGDKIAENTNSKIVADTKNIMLSFAAKIGDNMPADTYRSTVTMSVVSSPVQLALGDITTMQQMTSEICENTAPDATKQLKDVRDGKYYWVSKLADNKCWMTQNLDLDLNASTLPLTSETSDIKGNWTPMKGEEILYTADIADESTILASNIGQASWNMGNYQITNPNSSTSCSRPLNNASQCDTRFTSYNTPTTANNAIDAHYILGNHYQWNAATVGTGGTIAEGQAESSICPKGWRLPTSDINGEFEKLVTALEATSNVANITNAPFYGVKGGIINQNVSALFENAGYGGGYWSSTSSSNRNYTYLFSFHGASSVDSSFSGDRLTGRSIRCIAR